MRGALVLLLLAMLYFFLSADVGIYTDYLWFVSQGFQAVFLTVVGYEARYALLFGGVAALFVAANLTFARRRIGQRPTLIHDVLRYPWQSVQLLGWLIAPVSLFAGLLFGIGASAQWQTISLAMHHGSFHLTDPLLHRDVAFYVFTLPLLRFLANWAVTLVLLTAIATMGLYVLGLPGYIGVDSVANRFVFHPPRAVISHMAALLAVFLAIQAGVAWVVSPAQLLLGQQPVASGALYTDVYVSMPAYHVVAVVLVLGILGCVIAAVQQNQQRALALLALAPASWLVVSVIGLGIAPALIQSLVVHPTELQRQTPFIANNIRFTRAAFGLNTIKVEQHRVTDLTAADVTANPGTIDNMRLWDVRPLLQAYQQLQGLRPYYVFRTVAVDRYDGRQVMLSARELDTSRLPPQARTWVNEHFQYTHGFGAVASTVTSAQGQGQPDFVLSDIPPKATMPSLTVTQPQIYFGEQPSTWIAVGTNAQEFDYPSGNTNVYSRYQGHAGVAIGSEFRRLLFAWKFADPNLLLTGYLTPSSKIIYDHTIRDVVHKVAPYLLLDHDPYLVIVHGKLYWIWDAYTVSHNFPEATQVPGGVSYMRNSVKIVIDAYNGTATFYRMDTPAAPDPIIAAYSELFPSLYTPASQMPAAFRAHLRYPEDLFQTQARLFSLYHMTDPQVFYNREDAWALPTESQSGSQYLLQPYYVELRLPGQATPEFLLMEPFVPQSKQNMVAWLAAPSDPGRYGDLLAYQFSKDKLIFGPQQIEARIDQNTEISSNLTLWNQHGSRVVRGNLLVMPVGNAFLYVEPLFLQAEQSNIPELKRVILGTSTKIVIASTLQEGLTQLFGPTTTASSPAATTGPPSASAGASISASPTATAGAPSPAIAATPASAVAPSPATAALARDALAHYTQAQARLRAGDWTGYGTELAAMERDLKKLAAQNGG